MPSTGAALLFLFCGIHSSPGVTVFIKRKLKNDHRSKFSNLSNWKEEA